MPEQAQRRWKAFAPFAVGALVLLPLLVPLGAVVGLHLPRSWQREDMVRTIHDAGGFIADRGRDELSGRENLWVWFWPAMAGGRQAGDADVARLGTSDCAVGLTVTSDRLGDAGLAAISRLPHVRDLHIEGVSGNAQVTDEGLMHLAELHALSKLSLRNLTHVTDAGVRRLQKAMPLVRIDRQ